MSLIEAPQYSIWWVPDNPLRSELQEVINNLGLEFGADKYGAETFVPHITVVPDIIPGRHVGGGIKDLVVAVEEWVKTLKQSVEFELAEVAKLDSFFQCVFLRALKNELMLETVSQARQRFRPDLLGSDFMPHLSILYGDHPQDIRDQAIARAKKLLSLPQRFTGDKISLWTSGIPAKEWQMVAEYKIG